MKTIAVRLYQEGDFESWNAFIDKAKNATFLFHRDFMEYHKERFSDFSLIIESDNKWLAVLPANVVENQVFSHQGLTYGGLVYDEKLKLATVLAIFKTILIFLKSHKINTLQLKMLPSFYTNFPSEELHYGLFITKSILIRRDACAVIDLQQKFKLAKDRLRGISKAKVAGLTVKEEPNFELFWNEILIPNLAENHQAKPVHSLAEIQILHQKFPENIRQFNVYHGDKIVAGTTIFETKNVAHSQYISGNADKGFLGSVDFLHHYLLTEAFHDKRFFDFGISNENHGRNINGGLSYWKESFGANIIVQDFYEVATENHHLLEQVLL